MAVYGAVLDGIARSHQKNLEGQVDLLSFEAGEQSAAHTALPDLPEYTRQELMRMEKETTGLYLSGHPMDDYRGVARQNRAVSIGRILADFDRSEGPEVFGDEQKIVVAGVISAARTRTTRNNTLMSYITLEDDTGSMELLAFARVINECGSYIQENMPVLVWGKLSVRDEKSPQIMVDRLQPMDHLREQREDPGRDDRLPGQTLYVKVPSEGHAIWEKIRVLFSMFPGETSAVVVFADTRRRLGTHCGTHPALLEQLVEWLGTENVILK
jgi:DNA polymerase-3 subunit alpha